MPDDLPPAFLVPPVAPPLTPVLERLLADFDARKPAALARVVSMVENQRDGFDALLAALHPRIGRARRIGITGPPGAGKSTLTTRLTRAYREAGLTVGIVAVDPTSPFTGGALLGDRIRMEEVALDPGVFIRSLATRGSLGGLSSSTRVVADVLDAFGFDRILLETVGVGQSELDIARAAATGEQEEHWVPPVLRTVASKGEGIAELIDALDRHFRYLGASGELTRRRRARWREQILEVAEQRLRRRVWGDAGIQAFIEAALPDVEAGTSTPFGIADELLRRGAGILTRTVT